MFENTRNMIAAALVSASALSLSGTAFAATMNFDTLPGEGEQALEYVENGIRASALGGVLAFDNNPGFAHIDDSGTGFAFGADFTMAGLFDAVGFSLVSFGYSFLDTPPDRLAKNLSVSGYLGDTLVSNQRFALSDLFGAVQSIVLGENFAGISRLRIELLFPENAPFCDAPCAHFDLDSVTLDGVGIAPVPLPSGVTLMGAAGLMLWGLGHRRQTVSAKA